MGPPSGVSGWNHALLFKQRLEIASKIDGKARASYDLLPKWFERQWYDIFPLKLDDYEHGTTSLILISVIPSAATVGDSALNSLGDEEMMRIGTMLDSLPSSYRNVLVVTNHAPFRHAGEWRFFSRDLLLRPDSWKKARTAL